MKMIKLVTTAISLISQLAYAEDPTDYALKIPLKISEEGGLQGLNSPAAVFASRLKV
ncbi:MAG: hypothetical protein H7Z18_01125 [Methylophilaceae bacterium]|nr:hypothetical protein [Methylophilaceae bacterium]